MNVFEALEQDSRSGRETARRFDRDMKEAVRLLMTRREGRVFVQWLIEGQDVRAIMRRVLDYLEEKHV